MLFSFARSNGVLEMELDVIFSLHFSAFLQVYVVSGNWAPEVFCLKFFSLLHLQLVLVLGWYFLFKNKILLWSMVPW
ncbi:unnamed protein product, partial [Linum tenue]